MKGGDLYELAKILGHSNIKMTERCTKLGQRHIARTSNIAREIWKMMEREREEEQGNIPNMARNVSALFVRLNH
jgi:hypothetical protein